MTLLMRRKNKLLAVALAVSVEIIFAARAFANPAPAKLAGAGLAKARAAKIISTDTANATASNLFLRLINSVIYSPPCRTLRASERNRPGHFARHYKHR